MHAMAGNPDIFTDAYQRSFAQSTSVAELPAGSYTRAPVGVGEKLARCLWFDQFLDQESLRTEDGRRLTVLSPGYWNEGAGPDFHHAEIRFDDGEPMRGDVEVHVLASDYARHGHGGDPAYDRVALHVVFTNDLGQAHLDTAGRCVPQLALDRHLTDDLAEVLEALDFDVPRAAHPGNTGPCCAVIQRRGASWVGRFLDIAGDARVLAKADAHAEALQHTTPHQCLYAGLMDALGYKGNRRPFRSLAERAPISELRRLVPEDADGPDRVRHTEAILFGVAGLLPDPEESRDFDEATQVYLTPLRRIWAGVQRVFGERRVERSEWQFGKTRPVNYPPRRIAAAATFLGRHLHMGLFRAVVEALERASSEPEPGRHARAALRNVRGLFQHDDAGYWSRRYTFGGKPLTRPTRLLGDERARAMVVNVIIPLALACSRAEGNRPLEKVLHRIYASLGRMAENAVTRHMQARLFEDATSAREVVTNARRQQGLFQLYRDFCERPDMTCDQCAFLALAGASGEVPC